MLPPPNPNNSSISSSNASVPIKKSNVSICRQPSSKSVQSFVSIGIGNTKTNGARNACKQLGVEFVKLRPEGNNNLPNSITYDCIVYLIYCSEHDRFAVTNSDNSLVIWFPFVARIGRNSQSATHEGLLTLFERKVSDTDEVMRRLNFEYTTRCMELFRMQNVNGSWVLRITQFVTITKCKDSCQPINNIQWMDASYIITNCDEIFWGPEFRLYYENYLQKKCVGFPLNEQPIEQILQILNDPDRSNSGEFFSSLIMAANVTANMLCDLYEEYLNHTFPSYYMNYPSFRVFLRKCGFPIKHDDPNCPMARSLYNCCLNRPKRFSKEKYLDFNDVCYLLVNTDPSTPHETVRTRFVFTYYDKNSERSLGTEQIRQMVTDINKEMAKLPAGERRTLAMPVTSKLSMNEFVKEVTNDRLFGTDLLCRATQSLFAKFAAKKSIVRAGSGTLGLKVKSGFSNQDRGVCCRNCQVKTFVYRQHCVTIDSMGRCVEPKLILNFDNSLNMNTKKTGRSKYSLENIFRSTSLGNVFFDYIRNKTYLTQDNDKSDSRNFYEYFRGLCESVSQLIKHEPKLIKRTSPTLVIGNIQGNLDSLFTMQNNFWRTMPVVTQNTVFLGNYSGKSNYSIEVLIYLFAIKYINPNKVILLRGIQETRAYNEKTLLVDCKVRYGDVLGKMVWESVNKVFDYMPYITIVDESIVCTSSGIPKDAVKYKLDNLFENYSHIDMKAEAALNDCLIFQQIMANMPEVTPESRSSIRVGNKKEKGILFKPNPLMPNAYLFTGEAYRQFMNLNQFTYMIRSNEYLTNGYRIFFNKSGITIFSNSNNAPGEARNELVVAFIGHPDSKIHLIELE